MSTHQDTRMYESKYPEVDDVVMVQVKSIAEMGAYVALLEYNGIEGMILLSELSRRRIRSITKLIKVTGGTACFCVIALELQDDAAWTGWTTGACHGT